jgi:hypothetical protein
LATDKRGWTQIRQLPCFQSVLIGVYPRLTG